jgi:aspartate dehydrogenase
VSQPRVPLRVGIFGVGAIGQTLANALDHGRPGAVLVGIADQERALAEQFAAALTRPAPILSVDELVQRSDLIVESASQAALPEIVPKVLASGKDLLVLSVGGLLGHDEWFREAAERGSRIHVPSGAIAGLDALKAARTGRLDLVTLTSRKPIAALRGAKYVVEQGIDLEKFKEDTVIFEGSPEDACRNFPATSNVAASLRLTAGPEANIRVRVVATPTGKENVHEITAEGEFGRLRVVVENVPSAANPRTSALAALSALATLDGITSSFRIGT